jgi:hypothetical protein
MCRLVKRYWWGRGRHIGTPIVLRFRVNAEVYEGVSKSFRTDRLERELQTVQLSATKCSCTAILRVSLVSFVAITLCVASQRVYIAAAAAAAVVVDFVIDTVRKLLDTPSYIDSRQ